MKTFFIYMLVTFPALSMAQEIDSIYVHLYTDSLKKGTYNYINIDGRLRNGRYLPLDSTYILFSSSDGKFFGNTLWIDPQFSKEKINIKATLRSNPSVYKQFDIYIKRIPNPTNLKTVEELLNESKQSSNSRRRQRN
ncbi:MAG: hypothetical protein ABI288_05650 [Ginsengibacter sp.]